MRPPFCWNFFEDSEQKIPHVLRPDADPTKCYIDGRIESIIEDIYEIGLHLTLHEDQRWKTLRQFTIEIFKYEAKHEHEAKDDEETKKNQ